MSWKKSKRMIQGIDWTERWLPRRPIQTEATARRRPLGRPNLPKEPLTFLQDWLALRRGGQDFIHSTMGHITKASDFRQNTLSSARERSKAITRRIGRWLPSLRRRNQTWTRTVVTASTGWSISWRAGPAITWSRRPSPKARSNRRRPSSTRRNTAHPPMPRRVAVTAAPTSAFGDQICV